MFTCLSRACFSWLTAYERLRIIICLKVVVNLTAKAARVENFRVIIAVLILKNCFCFASTYYKTYNSLKVSDEPVEGLQYFTKSCFF
jgi:hypothetical protein